MYLKSMYIWVFGFLSFCRNRTHDLGINSRALHTYTSTHYIEIHLLMYRLIALYTDTSNYVFPINHIYLNTLRTYASTHYIQIHLIMYPHITLYINTSNYVSSYHIVYRYIWLCTLISFRIDTCNYVSSYFITYRYILLCILILHTDTSNCTSSYHII